MDVNGRSVRIATATALLLYLNFSVKYESARWKQKKTRLLRAKETKFRGNYSIYLKYIEKILENS